MTPQTHEWISNLSCAFYCSIVLQTFSKIHNFLIRYPILLKLVLIGLSDVSASIESKLFWEWTWPLKLFHNSGFHVHNTHKSEGLLLWFSAINSSIYSNWLFKNMIYFFTIIKTWERLDIDYWSKQCHLSHIWISTESVHV